ncbi:MAG: serine kinase [Acidobacteriota bacterium]
MTTLTEAFEHLAAPPTPDPSMTIHLFDSASTLSKPLAPAWETRDYLARGEIRGLNTDRFRAVYQIGSNALSLLDHERREAIYWMSDARDIAPYERGAPLRALLHWWTSRHHMQMAHAAAVGNARGGVVLAGKGGLGKSTAALACLEAGMLYAGDDYVLLCDAPSPFVYSLYNSAKIDSASAARFPRLSPFIINRERAEDEKAVLFLRDTEKAVAGFPLRALLAPRVTRTGKTKVEKISAIEGLKALAPSTIFQLPGAGRSAFDLLARLARQLPCFRIDLGSDVEEIPAVIEKLLSEI